MDMVARLSPSACPRPGAGGLRGVSMISVGVVGRPWPGSIACGRSPHPPSPDIQAGSSSLSAPLTEGELCPSVSPPLADSHSPYLSPPHLSFTPSPTPPSPQVKAVLCPSAPLPRRPTLPMFPLPRSTSSPPPSRRRSPAPPSPKNRGPNGRAFRVIRRQGSGSRETYPPDFENPEPGTRLRESRARQRAFHIVAHNTLSSRVKLTCPGPSLNHLKYIPPLHPPPPPGGGGGAEIGGEVGADTRGEGASRGEREGGEGGEGRLYKRRGPLDRARPAALHRAGGE